MIQKVVDQPVDLKIIEIAQKTNDIGSIGFFVVKNERKQFNWVVG